MSEQLWVCLHLSVPLSVHPSVYPSVGWSICPSLCLSVVWSAHLSVQLSIKKCICVPCKYIKQVLNECLYHHLLNNFLYPPFQRSWKRGILVSPCPSVRLSVCPSVDRIVSALYLQQYSWDPLHLAILSSNLRRCVMCKICLKNLKFWQILEICNSDFVFFWLAIQYDSVLWVIMRGGGGGGEVSSERWHSSCSS